MMRNGRTIGAGALFGRAVVDEEFEAVGEKGRNAYFPMQKLEKIFPNNSSEVNSPVISPRARCA